MKLRALVTLAILALAPAATADTVYYASSGSASVNSVTGTIVQQDAGVLVVETADGKRVSIPRGDVYQIVRDATTRSGLSDDPELTPESTDLLSTMPRAARLAGRDVGSWDSEPSAPRSYQLGAIAGMTMSNLPTDPGWLEESESLTSFTVGGWWRRPIRESLSVQAEAVYSVKGDSETSGGYTTSTKITYLDLPVLARYGFRKDSPLSPVLFAGPALGFNLSAHSTLEGPGTDVDVDVKDQVNTMDLGMVAGAGVDFEISGRTYGLELRYSKGLTNVAGDDAAGEARNNVLGILGSVTLQ